MQKQELVHLHALLVLIAEALDEVDEDAARADNGVRPSHVHRSRRAHRDAAFDLLDGIVDPIETDPSASGSTRRESTGSQGDATNRSTADSATDSDSSTPATAP